MQTVSLQSVQCLMVWTKLFSEDLKILNLQEACFWMAISFEDRNLWHQKLITFLEDISSEHFFRLFILSSPIEISLFCSWLDLEGLGLWFLMPLSTIFPLWQSVLLVEETRVPGENHQPVASHWQTLSHNVVSSTPRLSGIQTHNFSGDRHRLHR